MKRYLLLGGLLVVCGAILSVYALWTNSFGKWVSGLRGGGKEGTPISQAKGPWFVDVASESGVDFVHNHGGCGRRYVMEPMSAGVALFDYDGDGWIDIYFLNGAPLLGSDPNLKLFNALYRNLGGWQFQDVGGLAAVDDRGYGLGVASGDYNNDGFADLYVNNFGPNVLYRNNGDGTFSDVTSEAGVENGHRVGAGVVFFDMDRDGDLDLYVGNYIKFRYELHITRYVGGYPRYPSPREYEPDPDTLYRNNGDGSFTDVSAESGISRHAGTTMGITAADYDDDGDVDIFVCNDVRANFLFRNNGDGVFEEVALIAGTAYNGYGAENASMGVDAGDFNGDGRIDFYMTSYQGEFPVLYQNEGEGIFTDVTVERGAGQGCFPHVNWGTGFADFDNDGDRDLYVACGHVDDLIDYIDPSTSFAAPNVLLLNDGTGHFVDASKESGPGLQVCLPSRGTGLDDLDNDGDVDIVVLNLNSQASVLRNDLRGGGHWFQVRLIGTESSRDAVGARVRVFAGGRWQVDEVHSGRGYQSDHGKRLHFGLGKSNRVDKLEIRWPRGKVSVYGPLPADCFATFVEGEERPYISPVNP
ncbi:MAG: CRTAC1 family protein [Thermoguttaceae bacterium]|nr:CRTAC1 family protein [Thermoguttaceae bacterium]